MSLESREGAPPIIPLTSSQENKAPTTTEKRATTDLVATGKEPKTQLTLEERIVTDTFIQVVNAIGIALSALEDGVNKASVLGDFTERLRDAVFKAQCAVNSYSHFNGSKPNDKK